MQELLRERGRVSENNIWLKGNDMSKNPIENFVLVEADFHFIGHDLNKPNYIVAPDEHSLWATDARGGITRLSLSDTQQELFLSSPTKPNDQPNSFLFLNEHRVLIANAGLNCIEIFDLRNKTKTLLYDQVDGLPLGKVNYLLRDSKNRIWVSVSTRRPDILEAFNPNFNDGYIALIENNEIHTVAEGFAFANEMRFDREEKYLYIAETARKRIIRMEVTLDGRLINREVYGPADLGIGGFPDGIAFDNYGNLWATLVAAEKIIAIAPNGDCKTIFAGGEKTAIQKIEQAYQQRQLTADILFAGSYKITPMMTSLTFGGKNFNTVYIGSYGTRIPYFKAPVSGQNSAQMF